MSAEDQRQKQARQWAGSTSGSLLGRVQTNQSDAWTHLFQLYSPLVAYWCRQLGAPQQEVPDLVQDVFQSVARGIEKFKQENPGDTFRGWLRTITRNRVIDWARKNANQPHAAGGTVANQRLAEAPFPEIDASTDEERRITDQIYEQALRLVKDHFEPRTWQAFWRVVVDGQSPKDVADELSMLPRGKVACAQSTAARIGRSAHRSVPHCAARSQSARRVN